MHGHQLGLSGLNPLQFQFLLVLELLLGIVHDVVPLLDFLEDFIQRRPWIGVLNAQPHLHDGVLQDLSQLVAVLGLFVVVDYVAFVLVVSLAVVADDGVIDYVVKSWLVRPALDQQALMEIYLAVELGVALSKSFQLVLVQGEYIDLRLAVNVDILPVIHEKRIMVDNASSVEPIDYERKQVVRPVLHLQHSALHQVHLPRNVVLFDQVRALLVNLLLQTEDDVVLDELRQALEEVDPVERDLLEYLEGVHVLNDLASQQVVQVGVRGEQLHELDAVDRAQGDVV